MKIHFLVILTLSAAVQSFQQKGVFAKPGTEWNGMKFTFQENKKPGMERNGMEWKGMGYFIE